MDDQASSLPVALPVPVVRLDPELPLPSYAHPGDAGADLHTTVDVVLAPGERALVPTGCLQVELVHHRLPGSAARAAHLARVAAEAGLPTVLTNQVRYAERRDAATADVLDASRRLVALDRRHVDRTNAEGPGCWPAPARWPSAAPSTPAATSAWGRCTSRSSSSREARACSALAMTGGVLTRTRCSACAARGRSAIATAAAAWRWCGSASTTSSG